MRNPTTILAVFILGVLIGPVPTSFAELATGPAPDTYNTVNPTALKQLNDLYTAGKINFSDYQTKLVELEKPVTLIPSMGSSAESVNTPAAPEAISSPAQGRKPTPAPSNQCPPLPENAGIVYTRSGTCIQIVVNDSNRPLSDDEKNAIFSTLDLLPANHLSGITNFRIQSSSTSLTLGSTAKSIVLTLPANTKLSNISTLTLSAVGAHLYNWALTAKERYDFLYGTFDSSVISYSLPGDQIFGRDYAQFVTYSDGLFKGLATDEYSQGNQPFVMQALDVAAMFAIPKTPTQQGYYYAVSDTKVTQEILPFYRDSGFVSIGNYVFELNKDNRIIGWAIVGQPPFHKYSNSINLPLALLRYLNPLDGLK